MKFDMVAETWIDAAVPMTSLQCGENGMVGTSRNAVDKGWIRKGHQVGFSGDTIKPKLYIACGICDSLQHLAGMGDPETIVINSDFSAPIYKVADYSIVGDLYQMVPIMIKEIIREPEEAM